MEEHAERIEMKSEERILKEVWGTKSYAHQIGEE